MEESEITEKRSPIVTNKSSRNCYQSNYPVDKSQNECGGGGAERNSKLLKT